MSVESQDDKVIRIVTEAEAIQAGLKLGLDYYLDEETGHVCSLKSRAVLIVADLDEATKELKEKGGGVEHFISEDAGYAEALHETEMRLLNEDNFSKWLDEHLGRKSI